jgi:hypothetical protein
LTISGRVALWLRKVSGYGSVNLLRKQLHMHAVGPARLSSLYSYAAPEARVPTEQSPKMDIFSFEVHACTLLKCMIAKFPAVDARAAAHEIITN